MPGGLPERPALGLHFLAGVAVFVPGSRELTVLVADLLEPGFAVSDQPAADRPRHADPLAVDIVDDFRQVVIATLLLADRLGDIGDVGEALEIEARPVVDDHY